MCMCVGWNLVSIRLLSVCSMLFSTANILQVKNSKRIEFCSFGGTSSELYGTALHGQLRFQPSSLWVFHPKRIQFSKAILLDHSAGRTKMEATMLEIGMCSPGWTIGTHGEIQKVYTHTPHTLHRASTTEWLMVQIELTCCLYKYKMERMHTSNGRQRDSISAIM